MKVQKLILDDKNKTGYVQQIPVLFFSIGNKTKKDFYACLSNNIYAFLLHFSVQQSIHK